MPLTRPSTAGQQLQQAHIQRAVTSRKTGQATEAALKLRHDTASPKTAVVPPEKVKTAHIFFPRVFLPEKKDVLGQAVDRSVSPFNQANL